MKNKKRNLFLRIFDIRMLFFDFAKWTAVPFLWLVLRTKRIYISGKKPKGLTKGKYIIASNHISSWDQFTAASVALSRRVSMVSTKNLYNKCPLFFKLMHVVPVDNGKPSMSLFKKVKNFLYRGHIMCMFPEGYIVEGQELQTFKGGTVMMAALSQADILPIYIVRRKIFKQRQVVVVGEKIKYQDMFKSPMPTKEEIEKATKLLMEKEKELEEKYSLL